MTNADLCSKVFNFLQQIKVDHVVVCAGARNAPFVIHLEKQNFKNIHYFEERSAAFYALGLMESSGKPVAIITTSGTAAAELLPTTIEAYYQGLPLILITADRPKAYRGSGAPQTIHQPGLFSYYVEQCLDWDVNTAEFRIETALNRPVHLNICFDEPLIDSLSPILQMEKHTHLEKPFFKVAQKADFQKIKKPLVVVGQLHQSHVADVITWIRKVKAPVYLESLSQLRGEKSIAAYVLESTDVMVKKIFEHKLCESIVRIGNVPTLRIWRDLENTFINVTVYNFTNQNFSGLARPCENYKINFNEAIEDNSPALTKIKEFDTKLQREKLKLLLQYPESEAACVRHLSTAVNGAAVYLGNSLPIREWDEFSVGILSKNQPVYANRGANGIDGQVSTYLGWAVQKTLSWCVVGDLTALYDLAALGLAGNTSTVQRVVIINNFGGQIFSKVFNNNKFVNTHGIEFKMWASMWKWDYHMVKSQADFKNIADAGLNSVIEIQPDPLQSKLFNSDWDAICKTTSF